MNNHHKLETQVEETVALSTKVGLIVGMISAFLVGVVLVNSLSSRPKETPKATQTQKGVGVLGQKMEEDDFSQTEVLIKFKPDILKQENKEEKIRNIIDKALAQPLTVLPIKTQTTPPAVKQDISNQTVKAEFKQIKQTFQNTQDISKIKENFPQRTKRIPKDIPELPNLDNWYKLVLSKPIEKGAIKSLVERLTLNENIEYAEPNKRLQTTQVQINNPNDPYYYTKGAMWYMPDLLDMWGLYNIGLTPTTGEQPPNSGLSGWDYERGNENIVVAVIDTGLDYNHEDIIGNVWQNNDEIADNNIDDDGNGYIDDIRGWNFSYNNNDPMDDFGHGTHVSGTIAAVANNGIGVVGVCWYCKIMPIKGLDSLGYGYEDSLAEAIHYAADNGAEVINISWGGYGYSQLLSDAIDYAHSLGVVLVAAAGNSYDNAINYTPANHDKVITVAASHYFGNEKANFSNYGDKIDATAPGVDILSIKPQDVNFGVPFGDYKYAIASGTSMATPHVSGLAGLLISHYPNWSNDLIKGQIMSTTDDIPDSLSGILKHGKINTYKALTMEPKPHILIYNHSIDDSSGNNDEKIDPGETVKINVTLKNYGYQATRVFATLTTKDPCVIVGSPLFPPLSTFGDLATDSTALNQTPYVVTLKSDCSFRNITFYLDISADNSYSQKDKFQVVYPFSFSYQQGWPISTVLNGGEATPLLINLDNDTDLEIVVGTKDKVYAFDYDGSSLPGWPINVQGFVTSAKPIYGNFDNDAYPEIIFATFTWYNHNPAENKLHVVNHDGTYVQGWPIQTDKEVREAPAVADINQDGYDEIIFSSINVGHPYGNKIYVLDRNGNNISGWPFTFGYSYSGAHQPTVADLNKDGNLEIIFGGWQKLYVWNNQGQPYNSCWPLELSETSLGPAVVADLDQNNQLEIIVGTEVFNNELTYYEAQLFAINDDCTFTEGWPVNFGFHKNFDFTPVVGDIDNDGDLEILDVTHEYNKIYAFHHDGTRVDGWPIIADFVRRISLADLDNDNTLEILAGTCYSPWGGCWGGENNHYELQAWHFDGKPVAGFPIMWINNQGQTQPLVADLDRDGDLELISAARSQWGYDLSTVHVFDLPHHGNLEWSMYQADLGNTGLYNQTNQCLDSTPFGQCSSIAPRYCDNGVLSINCSRCASKCPSGYPYCNEQKGLCEAKCTDGTPFGRCNGRYQYCSAGKLYSWCMSCGCPRGQTCKKMTGYPAGKCVGTVEPTPSAL